MSSDKQSAYSAFSAVDSLVSKPIYGSDGAASWQSFQKSTNQNPNTTSSLIKPSVAPHLPSKRIDKLSTGFKSIQEERNHEAKLRQESGDAALGSGYTTFKRKGETASEIAEKKRRKMIEERVRPDHAKYFIASEVFVGKKEDYVFTTRQRGTGYYWDGWDSYTKLINNGDLGESSEEPKTNLVNDGIETDITTRQDGETKTIKTKKKKKKNSTKVDSNATNTPVVVDTNNPMEQIQIALQRRNEILSQPQFNNSSTSAQISAQRIETSALTAPILLNNSMTNTSSTTSTAITNNNDPQNTTSNTPIWESATDPSSNKVYYFCRSTGERRWDNPHSESSTAYTQEVIPISSTNTTTVNNDTSTTTTLPDGWNSATDPNSGKIYYYHTASGKTSWEKPTS